MSELGRGRGRVAAALIVLLALLAREQLAPVATESGATATVTNVESAWRLHRISLAVSSPRLAQVDRAVSFPGVRDVTQLPVFDELCAFAARLGLGISRGAVGELPRQRRLERFLRGVAPLLTALTLLLLYRLLRRAERFRPPAALAGLAVVACLPGYVALGVPGSLTIEALVACGVVLVVSLMSGVFRRGDPLDRMTYAMLSGAGIGIGLSTSPLFLALLVAALAVLLLELQFTAGEERLAVARTALLLWVSATLLSQLPTLGGPWVPADEGVIAEWSSLLQRVLLISVLPFVLGLASPARVISRRLIRMALSVAGLTLLFVLCASEPALALLDSISGPTGARAPAMLGVLVGSAFTLGWLWRERGALGAEERFLGLLGGIGLIAATWAPAAIVLSLPTLAHAVSSCACAARGRIASWTLAGVLLLVGWFAGAGDEPEQKLREETARACAWLGENSPRTGAWGAATAVQDWGVGIEPELAPLLAWHGRRAAAGFASHWAHAAQESDLASGLSSAADLEEFFSRSRASGLRYWVLAPGSAARLGCSPGLCEQLEELRSGDSSTAGGASLLWSSSADGPSAVSILGLDQP